MTKEQFKEEKNYQASKMCFRQMLEKGIITQEEYKQIGTILLENISLYWVVYSSEIA